MKLFLFELEKTWRKRSFWLLTFALLAMNLFLLWYFNMPGETELPFAAYRAIASELRGMTQPEKLDYITRLREQIDAIAIINSIGNLLVNGDGMSEMIAMQLQKENRETIEQYGEVYQSGGYLVYTDSLQQEEAFLREIYNEIKMVSGYEEYLDFVRENRRTLSSIAIFSSGEKRTFGSRNIEKSAEDHRRLSGRNIRYLPAKGFRMADGSLVTELFLLLAVLLFASGLVAEEKEKGLLELIRGTKHGTVMSIGAKLAALLVHSITVSGLFYGSDLLFAAATAGLGDPGAAIQSVPAFQESSLEICLLDYILLGILLKGVVLFCFGEAVVLAALFSRKKFVPPLCGVGIAAVNLLLFTCVPAASKLAPAKFLSLFGLLKPELLLGGYLNFNFAGFPISRLAAAIVFLAVLCVGGAAACVSEVCQGERFRLSGVGMGNPGWKKPSASLFLHEGIKILFPGRAFVVLLLFLLLIGGRDLGKNYAPSVQENYYRDIMTTLEGELTEEKEALLAAEQLRFDEAFARLEEIDDLVAGGDIDEAAGADRKAKWLGILSFYPAFQRVMGEYEHIREKGGVFLYDTGYNYLFGRMDDGLPVDFLLLSLGIVFAFANVMAMENERNMWNLLSATRRGRRAVIKGKILICAACTMVFSLLPYFFRLRAISAEYPMRGWTERVQNIPAYSGFPVFMPIWLFAIIMAGCQIAAALLVCGIVLLLSRWRGNYLQTVFIALLLLVVPSVLALMGFGVAKWASFYPLYGLTGILCGGLRLL